MGPARLNELLVDDLGIDRLESFGAKFGQMQDTVVDKLIPTVLRQAGEPAAAAIDSSGRMERLELIASSSEWLEIRGLRKAVWLAENVITMVKTVVFPRPLLFAQRYQLFGYRDEVVTLER